MISVLVLGFDTTGRAAATPGDVVRTLASLVPATVDGVVRDLYLAAPVDAGSLADVADHAGCGFSPARDVEQAIGAGAGQLRCTHVLVMRAGTVLDRGIVEELTSYLPGLPDSTRAYVLRAERRDLVGRLFPSMAPAAGLLCAKTWLVSVKAASLAQLVRRAGRTLAFRSVARS